MISLIFAILSLVTPIPANAQEHLITPAPTVVPTSEATPASNNLEEIQHIREAVQQKVQEKLRAITSSSKDVKKGWIGTISAIDVDKLTLNYEGAQRQVTFDPNTVFIDAKRQKTTYDKIKVGQSVLAMGSMASDQSLSAVRIVVTDLTTLTKKQIVIGKIADISKTSSIFTLIPTVNKSLQYQVKTDANTTIVNKANGKLEYKTLAAGQRAIAVLSQDPKNPKSYTALKIIALDILTPASPTAKPTK